MKLRIGTKLNNIKIEKYLTQEQMAELLGLSVSAYGRLERNETSLELDELSRYSKVLDVPIHEFLPETFQINNTPNYSQGGIVFGNFYYYADSENEIAKKNSETEILKKEIEALREEVKNLKLSNKK
ncbi:MAG: helix-turn-helix transcriptional regulator [Bacteroidetes bacterium]|nr:helix-turn-helix transcriptional regulator [Bacteroidota bacterium]